MNKGIERVRGKFVVNSITRHRGSAPDPNDPKGPWIAHEMQTVEMGVVMGGSPEDNSFAIASPSGSIKLSITRPEVVDFFELDAKVYVDFTIAEPSNLKPFGEVQSRKDENIERTVDHLMTNSVKGSDFAPKS